MSASQKKPWTKFMKRANMTGQERVGKATPFRGEAAYVGRLRRLETVVLVLTMKLKVHPKALDKLLEDMLLVEHVQAPSSGSTDPGGPIQVPHEGAPDG